MTALISKNIFGNQKGLALLLTLLVTAILTTVVIEYNYDANVNIDIARNYKNKMKASYLAKSGIRFVNLYLTSDIDSIVADGLADIKALLHGKPIPLGSGIVVINMDSEEGKINLNKLLVSENMKERLINLFNNLDIDETVYYSLIDWIDTDDDVEEGDGAESDYYETLMTPYPCKNGPFESLDEIKLVKGVTSEVFDKIKNRVTIFSSGLININEADREVLLSLSEELTEYDVDKIIEDRKEKEYEDINELAYLGDVFDKIKGSITTESRFYKVTAVGAVEEIRYKIVNYIEKGTKLRLLYSKEE